VHTPATRNTRLTNANKTRARQNEWRPSSRSKRPVGILLTRMLYFALYRDYIAAIVSISSVANHSSGILKNHIDYELSMKAVYVFQAKSTRVQMQHQVFLIVFGGLEYLAITRDAKSLYHDEDRRFPVVLRFDGNHPSFSSTVTMYRYQLPCNPRSRYRIADNLLY